MDMSQDCTQDALSEGRQARRVIAYLRCSTGKQDAASQRQQVDAWVARTGRVINEIVYDDASGSTPWQKRRLAEVIATSKPGECVIVSEISRIARSTQGVLSFLQAAAEKQIEVVAVQTGIAFDGSLQSKVTTTILALVAEIERDLLRERTRAALAARRAAGIQLGRPAGSTRPTKLESRREEIDRCIKARVPLRAIARIIGCAPGTLYKALAQWGYSTRAAQSLRGDSIG